MFATRSRLPPLRSLASLSPSQINTATRSPFQVFDRHAKRLQKDRAAARDGGNRSRTVDYVRDDVANRMIERFMASIYSAQLSYNLAETDQDIKRNFSSVLDLGSGSGHFAKLLESDQTKKVTMLDLSSKG
jgi:NADH dehydrogenase [ubiquinone] 1 alpha subcomplex assembly factor 5